MERKPHVYCITATCGRITTLQRLVACFIAQDYEGLHTLLIYNNSEVSQDLKLPILPPNKMVELVNNHLDRETGKPYENLGVIYRDALDEVPNFAEVVTHMDDDDIFMPNHISEGVKGFQRALDSDMGMPPRTYYAYKPQQSWFRHALGVDLMGNNLEPSIFIDGNYLKKYGYLQTTTDQHFGWFQPLLQNNEMLVDPHGVPTLIYNWGDVNIPTFKTSGNSGNPDNFMNYRIFSQDHGNGIITPVERKELDTYYNQIYAKQAVSL